MDSQTQTSNDRQAKLHVFAENGFWHWGISVRRERGSGFQVVAYNRASFTDEIDAVQDGGLALERLSHDRHRQYMKERLRCAMARLVRSDEAAVPQAAKWVNAWGALIGEQQFDDLMRKRPKTCISEV